MNNTKIKLSSIDTQNYNPTLNTEREIANSFVSWGLNNNFPEYLYNTVNNCATLSSILNGSIDFTIGNDIVNNSKLQEENSLGETLSDTISKLIIDRWFFGGFAFQVLYNAFNEITEICYIDFRKVRVDKNSEYAYVNEEWSGWGQSKNTKKYKQFNPATGAENGIQIYYYKGVKTRSVYPVPEYSAALVSAETQIEIQKFHYSTLINNFIVNAIISWNDGIPEPEEQQKIEKAINDKFTGTKNAAKIMVNWNENKDSAITVQKLTSDDFDKKYEALSESTRENLFIACRAMPQLFGLNYNTGFSEVEYLEAFKFYNRTAILPKQKEIIRIFDKVLGDGAISFVPFSLEDTTNTTQEEKIIEKTE